MSTILAGWGIQRCLSAAAGGSTCRQRCDGLPVTAGIFFWNFSVVAYEQLLATRFGQSG